MKAECWTRSVINIVLRFVLNDKQFVLWTKNPTQTKINRTLSEVLLRKSEDRGGEALGDDCLYNPRRILLKNLLISL